jgi:epoxyqueuosine reductase
MSPRRVPPSAAWTLDAAGSGPAKSPADAARRLKDAARSLGFNPVGVADAELPAVDAERLQAWIDAGRNGDMAYLNRADRDRANPETLLEGAKSVLMVGLAYPPNRSTEPAAPGTARISTYAQANLDYHRVLGARLALLVDYACELLPGAKARRFCDTAPLLERAFAVRAGLGFVGKNTNLIHRTLGSYFFLGGLALDRRLPADGPDPIGACGTCTRCLEACPTDAFPAPYVLDARRCISYLTIEHRGAYAEELRADVGNHAFGCDVCQAVCPWSVKFSPAGDPELASDPNRTDPPLLELYARARDGFKSLARGTPWERTGKRGFLRNLATAMGNHGDASHRDAVDELAAHEDPAVAEHGAWAQAKLRERLGNS